MICLLLKKVNQFRRGQANHPRLQTYTRVEVCVFNHHKLMPTKQTYKEKNELMREQYEHACRKES